MEDNLRPYYQKFLDLNRGTSFLVFADSVHTFIVGLAAFQLYRKTHSPILLNQGRKAIAEMKKWAEEGSLFNFQQKLLLLIAEEYFCIGDMKGARDSYKAATTAAKNHRFINDEALGLDLTARFFLQTNDLPLAHQHFKLASKKYYEWGAVVKAQKLDAFLLDKFGSEQIYFQLLVKKQL